MKNTFKILLAVLATTALMVSCNDDNDIIGNTAGTGNLAIEFDNAFAGNDLILNAANTATSNNEILTISSAKYFISNIALTDENGITFTYPKSGGYFIVDESDEQSLLLHLSNIPAANYTKIKFGIGVDQANANDAQLIAAATDAGLYNEDKFTFLALQGQFTSPTVSPQNPYSIRVNPTVTDYNYHEVTLDLPQKALVRTEITPEIHVVADLSKAIEGHHKVKLSDYVSGNAVDIHSGETVDDIAHNLAEIFSVAHVHND
jgi:hypothetical protein